MKHYVAFLDILGFSQMVETVDLPLLKRRLTLALQAVSLAENHGARQNEPAKARKPFHCFSFSDTFVLSSLDDTPGAFVSLIIGTSLLCRYLFAQSLPVRGAVTFGEADFIPGTNHLIGKAIIAAHALEKKQEWLGVIVDSGSLPSEAVAMLDLPLIAPLVARWNVPLKDHQTCENALVVNWRLNLVVEKGTQSLFRRSEDQSANQKIDNTLAFAKHLRISRRHLAYPRDNSNKPVNISWLSTCTVSANDPRSGVTHGDEF